MIFLIDTNHHTHRQYCLGGSLDILWAKNSYMIRETVFVFLLFFGHIDPSLEISVGAWKSYILRKRI